MTPAICCKRDRELWLTIAISLLNLVKHGWTGSITRDVAVHDRASGLNSVSRGASNISRHDQRELDQVLALPDPARAPGDQTFPRRFQLRGPSPCVDCNAFPVANRAEIPIRRLSPTVCSLLVRRMTSTSADKESALVKIRTILPLSVFLLLVARGVYADPGILLLAHGGSPEWNARVTELAAQVNKTRPTEVAFGMATRATMQAGIDRLVA